MAGVLVACVGNIFLADDGFGSAVGATLATREIPEGVKVVDYGIRSVHLVYDLMDGYDVLVVVDTVSQQSGGPGTLYVIEPDLGAQEAPEVLNPHDLSPGGVMALLPSLGGQVRRILVVGCQPASLDEGIGLTDAVRAAVEPAADLVLGVVARELAAGPPSDAQPMTSR